MTSEEVYFGRFFVVCIELVQDYLFLVLVEQIANLSFFHIRDNYVSQDMVCQTIFIAEIGNAPVSSVSINYSKKVVCRYSKGDCHLLQSIISGLCFAFQPFAYLALFNSDDFGKLYLCQAIFFQKLR